MSDAWTQYRGAPVAGTTLCRADELHDGTTKSVALGEQQFPVLLVRAQGITRAFVNACPHHFLPLDHRGDKVLSADGTVLRCTNHSAGFRVDDGWGVEGLGMGCALDRIPIWEDHHGMICVGAPNEQS